MERKNLDCKTRKRGKLCGKEECKPCFERSFASNEKSKYLAEGQRNPFLIARSGVIKLSFLCPRCEHLFETTPNSISRGVFCPFCGSNRLCLDDGCEICFEKSFASNKKSVFWDSEKNGQSPRETFANSGKKFFFICPVCSHSFATTLYGVSNGHFCPFCSNNVLCASNGCRTCFEKSFASNEKSVFWASEKNKQTPRQVFRRSNKKFWFSCGVCRHNFEMNLSGISNGHFCPFCSNQKLCLSNDCRACFEKSFASHERVKYWDVEKNQTLPRRVFAGSDKKYWFVCGKKHEFSSILHHISKGQWCPKCKNKTEAKLFSFLGEHFKDLVHQFKVSWCKNPETDKYLPFDFCVSKTIIELDGPQHYKQVMNWQSPELAQKNDRYKEECATKNGYSVLRILQEDVRNDRIDWKKLLLEHIKDYDEPIVKNLWE